MSPQASGTGHGTRKRQKGTGGATGADLTASGGLVRLVRRRRTPDHPWRWRAVCDRCGPLGEGWTTAEQAATEEGFEHARRHVEPEQLTLELELPNGRRARRAA